MTKRFVCGTVLVVICLSVFVVKVISQTSQPNTIPKNPITAAKPVPSPFPVAQSPPTGAVPLPKIDPLLLGQVGQGQSLDQLNDRVRFAIMCQEKERLGQGQSAQSQSTQGQNAQSAPEQGRIAQGQTTQSQIAQVKFTQGTGAQGKVQDQSVEQLAEALKAVRAHQKELQAQEVELLARMAAKIDEKRKDLEKAQEVLHQLGGDPRRLKP